MIFQFFAILFLVIPMHLCQQENDFSLPPSLKRVRSSDALGELDVNSNENKKRLKRGRSISSIEQLPESERSWMKAASIQKTRLEQLEPFMIQSNAKFRRMGENKRKDPLRQRVDAETDSIFRDAIRANQYSTNERSNPMRKGMDIETHPELRYAINRANPLRQGTSYEKDPQLREAIRRRNEPQTVGELDDVVQSMIYPQDASEFSSQWDRKEPDHPPPKNRIPIL